MILKGNSSRERSETKARSGKRRLFKWLALPLAIGALGWGYHDLQQYWVKPEAIFVLGGHEDRERFAAKLARKYPDLPIWVSSGSPRPYVKKIFQHAGISLDRLHLDYRAKDTVTNFTTLADELKAQGIDSVYLVTSENHMGRARLVGEIIFGSRGITLKPVSVPSKSPDEPIEKRLRDSARAILWVTTGSTGESWLDHR
ncbi:YdcF family protein [Pannus brasiliensis CCIBt3594]|uniref:YdcF family protein n=1 Tax=Pannus brasiliensis CCIBt3594 TaxID=1427578 RepID=A0AAW9QGN9_9CHRO